MFSNAGFELTYSTQPSVDKIQFRISGDKITDQLNGSQVLELIDDMDFEDMPSVFEDEAVALPPGSAAAIAQQQGDTDALASALGELGADRCRGLLRKHFGID